MKHKIEAELDGDRIKVNAKFYEGKKKVHEINHAFSSDMSAKDIKKEVEKAGDLYLLEKKQAEERKEEEEEREKANKTVDKLNK